MIQLWSLQLSGGKKKKKKKYSSPIGRTPDGTSVMSVTLGTRAFIFEVAVHRHNGYFCEVEIL